jgi:hypothetical protein
MRHTAEDQDNGPDLPWRELLILAVAVFAIAVGGGALSFSWVFGPPSD